MATDPTTRPPKRRGDGNSWARGVDNRSHETKLADGYVRWADNVDIGDDGMSSSREGYDLWVALPGAHSAWSHELLDFALVADAGTLYRLDAAGTLTALVAGLNGSKLSYALVGRRVRWSNGVQTGQVDLDGTPAPLGVATPRPSFTVTAVGIGGLFAGRYGVTLTFADANREEGGAPETVYVDVAEGGGIQVGDVPPDAAGTAVEARFYVTSANGEELLYAGSALPGATAFAIGAGPRTRLLSTQFCEPFPAATCLMAKAGRLLGALGRDVVWSQPMYYGLWRPTKNSLRLPAEVVMLAAPDSPQFIVYVGTREKVYVLAGDSIDTCTLSVACGAGVIPGSMAMVPGEALRMDGVLAPVPLWMGSDGVPYAGLPAGVVPLSQVFAMPRLYDEAAAAFVERNGLSRWLVSGQGGSANALVASDHTSIELIQAGP
jgi:hypothetical protein